MRNAPHGTLGPTAHDAADPARRASSSYVQRPSLRIEGATGAVCGPDAIVERLRTLIEQASLTSSPRTVLALECYPGVDLAALREAIVRPLSPALVIDADELMQDAADIQERIADCVTDDRVFGVMSHHVVDDFLDERRLSAARERVAAVEGLVVVLGFGTTCLARPDVFAYAALTRWEVQLRWRSGAPNWKADNPHEDQLRKFKRGYFFEWRVADRLKRRILPDVDLLIDANAQDPSGLTAIPGAVWREGLRQFASRPFRLVPYFDASPWGGTWMEDRFGLAPKTANYGWAFDGVPEENSVILDVEGTPVEVPAMDVVLSQPDLLLGPLVRARFGTEFPIRFDFLDTWDGGNLSLQVHPRTEYAFDRFGLAYTQDESYYIFDAREGSTVYLGLKTGVSKGEFVAALERAQETGEKLDVERYVNAIPVSRHDHVSIPAGTIHCSGSNTVVLEISATPYIFTFKLWDWGRLGLDGKPRPINIERGAQNIVEGRDTAYCNERLVNRMDPGEADAQLAPGAQGAASSHDDEGPGTHTGLSEMEFIETRRLWLADELTLDTRGTVNMLNLVEGSAVEVMPLGDGALFANAADEQSPKADPLCVHYGETFIVPASVGRFRIRNVGGGRAAVVRAYVRNTETR
ncbi:class I mannose-6-phosphate isomerase [Olsenella sp. HMSC062G07]|uniref:class I mannose-6-phosphate isomerase n=1 Tax=Olsenella sp. HMSC062G07 TaxID=1739330 RepID=UPI000A995959|nr:class I mannose-6-phosphate isomerase [Olsenella sp. HMSC062G07]